MLDGTPLIPIDSAVAATGDMANGISSTEAKYEFRQLAIAEFSPNDQYTHMLIYSTAPANAEQRARESGDTDKTNEGLAAFRDSFRRFLKAELTKGNNASERLKGRLKLVLNIHGYSTPLENFLKNAYITGQEQIENSFLDGYVLFVDYSWPSEQALSLSLPSIVKSMPFGLRALILVAFGMLIPALLHLFKAELLAGWGFAALAIAGGVLLGISLALVLLRMITYFRDRDRAASAGVYDCVELVRWMHSIFSDEITAVTKELTATNELDQQEVTALLNPQTVTARSGEDRDCLIELSVMAHSMGAFVATQTVRTLSDVFDSSAIDHWKKLSPLGPFGKIDPSRSNLSDSDSNRTEVSGRIGNLFQLSTLVLVSPDIPVWALATGRSNQLQASLRRFREVCIFTNDADVVLRLASTLANYFVFPSSTRQGGYRLGNVVNLAKQPGQRWGYTKLDLSEIGVRGLKQDLPLSGNPFLARSVVGQRLSIVDCTDYNDKLVPSLEKQFKREAPEDEPRLSAGSGLPRIFRYGLTTLQYAVGWKQMDAHGGYFRGATCLKLIYQLLLHGTTRNPGGVVKAMAMGPVQPEKIDDLLRGRKISWVDVEVPKT